MMVICKSNRESLEFDRKIINGLTIEKSYKVTDVDSIGYRIIDDHFRNYWCSKELFYPISEHRDRILNLLLTKI